MTTLPNQFLFVGTDLRVRFDNVRHALFDRIALMSDAQITSRSVDDWVTLLVQENSEDVPTIDPGNCSTTIADGTVYQQQVPNPNYRVGAQAIVQGKIYTLHIPYKGDRSLFYVRPSSHPISAPTAATDEHEILVDVSGAWHDSASINKAFDESIALIEDYLARLRTEVASFNSGLGAELRPRLQARLAAAQQSKATASGLKYPIRLRDDAPPPPSVPAIRQKLAKPAPLPSSTPGRDPQLEAEHYANILTIIEGMSAVMERSPHAFAVMPEEHIRFHFLVQLNAQYDGEALGEAFNLGGRTDILVRHQNQNLFVGEFKFWGGEKVMLETIEQLYKYLTWRDTRTAIVFFSKLRNFTRAVDEAERVLKEHPLRVSGPTKQGSSRFHCVFKFPNDPDRLVILTVLLFHIPAPE